MKKNTIFFIFAIIFQSSCLFSALKVEKDWDLPLNEVFKSKTPVKLSEAFYPIYQEGNLILGSYNGEIISINSKNKNISKIIDLPIYVDNGELFGRRFILFKGRHKFTKSDFLCSVNVPNKKVEGVIRENTVMLPYKQWVVVERNKTFHVFSPQKGREVYSQYVNLTLKRPIHATDKTKTYFLTHNQEIISLDIVDFGENKIMHNNGEPGNVLRFKPIIKIPAEFIPDTIDGFTLYYHTTDGKLGKLDLDSKQPDWEKPYFTNTHSIKGPLIDGHKLIYLISYSKEDLSKANQGKLIALNSKNGQSVWVSKDLEYSNFDITQFGRSIVSSDLEGNLVLLDIETGKPLFKEKIGSGMTNPISIETELFILTKEHLYKFENTDKFYKLKEFLSAILPFT